MEDTKNKDIYKFFAVFKKDENNQYEVNFPDIKNCFTCGSSLDEAIYNAKDVLGLILFDMEEENKEIPKTTEPQNIKLQANEFLMLIDVYMPLVRETINTRAVKKTLTIPYWMNKLASENNINFSQVLQTALKRELKIR